MWETFVVVVDDAGVTKVIATFTTQKDAVRVAKKYLGAWVETRGGDHDGEVAWQSR